MVTTNPRWSGRYCCRGVTYIFGRQKSTAEQKKYPVAIFSIWERDKKVPKNQQNFLNCGHNLRFVLISAKQGLGPQLGPVPSSTAATSPPTDC